VYKRSAEGTRVQVEACGYQSDDEKEQADVEEKEDAADCVDATEAERDCVVSLALHCERGEGIEIKEQKGENKYLRIARWLLHPSPSSRRTTVCQSRSFPLLFSSPPHPHVPTSM
jgi:hypothetical protein